MSIETMKLILDLLINAFDLQQSEIEDHITKYGEWYRPQRVEFMKKYLSDTEEAMKILRAEIERAEDL